jgi:hypothetical protein
MPAVSLTQTICLVFFSNQPWINGNLILIQKSKDLNISLSLLPGPFWDDMFFALD